MEPKRNGCVLHADPSGSQKKNHAGKTHAVSSSSVTLHAELGSEKQSDSFRWDEISKMCQRVRDDAIAKGFTEESRREQDELSNAPLTVVEWNYWQTQRVIYYRELLYGNIPPGTYSVPNSKVPGNGTNENSVQKNSNGGIEKARVQSIELRSDKNEVGGKSNSEEPGNTKRIGISSTGSENVPRRIVSKEIRITAELENRVEQLEKLLEQMSEKIKKISRPEGSELPGETFTPNY